MGYMDSRRAGPGGPDFHRDSHCDGDLHSDRDPTATATATQTVTPTPATPRNHNIGDPTPSDTPLRLIGNAYYVGDSDRNGYTHSDREPDCHRHGNGDRYCYSDGDSDRHSTPPFGTLSVSGNLSFGKIKVNSTASKKLKVKNKGKAPLQ